MQSFPSYRFDGDKNAAAALRLTAQNLLHQARLIDAVSASRITKLNRSTPAGEVEVLIIEGQEYVNIFGLGGQRGPTKKVARAVFRALSGLVRGGGVVEVAGVKKVRDYRPTEDAFEKVLDSAEGKEPAIFHDEELLVDAPLQGGCAFSGLMAKMVQLVSGFAAIEVEGELDIDPADGVFSLAAFQSNYFCTHGIVKLADTPWLVEISRDNGVIAMRLPLAEVKLVNEEDFEPGSGLQIVKCLASDECERLFGGIPSGRGFPPQARMAQAIADGVVTQLLPTSAFGDYYLLAQNLTPPFIENESYTAYEPHSASLGWSFNSTGSEAHNTQAELLLFGRIEANNGGLVGLEYGDISFGLHHRISFAEASGELTAQFELVSRDHIVNDNLFPTAFQFGPTDSFRSATHPARIGGPGAFTSDAVILVLHRGDQLVKCRLAARASEGGQIHTRVYVDGASVGPTQESRTALRITSTYSLYQSGFPPGEAPVISGPVPNADGGTSFVYTEGASILLVDGEYVNYQEEDGNIFIKFLPGPDNVIYPGASPNIPGSFLSYRTLHAKIWWSANARDAFVCENSFTVETESAALVVQFGGVYISGNLGTTVVTPDAIYSNVRPPNPAFANTGPASAGYVGRPWLPPKGSGPTSGNLFIAYSAVGSSPHAVVPMTTYSPDGEPPHDPMLYPANFFGWTLGGDLFAGEPDPQLDGRKYTFIGYI